MQYIKLKYQTDEVNLFFDDDMDGDIQPIPREDYERLINFLQDYNHQQYFQARELIMLDFVSVKPVVLHDRRYILKNRALQSDAISTMMVQGIRTSSDRPRGKSKDC